MATAMAIHVVLIQGETDRFYTVQMAGGGVYENTTVGQVKLLDGKWIIRDDVEPRNFRTAFAAALVLASEYEESNVWHDGPSAHKVRNS
jgi:hypothetical protein